jgi:hypothetical protein
MATVYIVWDRDKRIAVPGTSQRQMTRPPMRTGSRQERTAAARPVRGML